MPLPVIICILPPKTFNFCSKLWRWTNEKVFKLNNPKPKFWMEISNKIGSIDCVHIYKIWVSNLCSALTLSLISCSFYCCCRRACLKRSGEQDSYSGSIVGRQQDSRGGTDCCVQASPPVTSRASYSPRVFWSRARAPGSASTCPATLTGASRSPATAPLQSLRFPPCLSLSL